jgi:hypothetical protein
MEKPYDTIQTDTERREAEKYSRKSVHELSEGIRKDASKLTPSVATPVVATRTHDSIYNVHEPREATRHDTGKQQPVVASMTQDSI